jgi:hypothetical protein
MLEAFGFPSGVYHVDHHEVFGVTIEPIVSELLATCFCDFCQTKTKI